MLTVCIYCVINVVMVKYTEQTQLPRRETKRNIVSLALLISGENVQSAVPTITVMIKCCVMR